MMMQRDLSNSEIQISEEIIHKLGWVLLGIAVLFTIIGGFVSPIDDQGKPVLLLPDVKAMENYRRSAQTWLKDLTILDGEIALVLGTQQQGDLFSLSRASQQTLQHALDLVQEVDRTKVPPIGMGIHELVLSTTVHYLETARSALQWVSAPDQENRNTAVEMLTKARTMKSDLEANQWLTTP